VCRAKSGVVPCELCIFVERSSGSPVLVDHAAENASPEYGCADLCDHARIVAGRVLIEALVWTMPDEVIFVLAQHGAGMVFVIDEKPVCAFVSNAADEAFGERVGRRCQLHRMRTIGTDVFG
jgi:hypothetical protein